MLSHTSIKDLLDMTIRQFTNVAIALANVLQRRNNS